MKKLFILSLVLGSAILTGCNRNDTSSNHSSQVPGVTSSSSNITPSTHSSSPLIDPSIIDPSLPNNNTSN